MGTIIQCLPVQINRIIINLIIHFAFFEQSFLRRGKIHIRCAKETGTQREKNVRYVKFRLYTCAMHPTVDTHLRG